MVNRVCWRCHFLQRQPSQPTRVSLYRQQTRPYSVHSPLRATPTPESAPIPSHSAAQFAGIGSISGLDPSKIQNGVPEVRQHLQGWFKRHLEEVKSQVEVQSDDGKVAEHGKIKHLPDSLFMNEPEAERNDGEDQSAIDQYDDLTQGLPRNRFEPGDLLLGQFNGARRIATVYLGKCESQEQYFMSTGRWAQAKTNHHNSDVIKGWASEEEMAPIRALLPKKQIVRRNDNGIPVGVSFISNLEHSNNVEKPLLRRLQLLEEQIVEFRRKFHPLLDDAYERLAQENEFVTLQFSDFARQLLGDDADRLGDAARLCICRTAIQNPTKTFIFSSFDQSVLQVLMGPKSAVRRFEKVVQWTREYQELAAVAVRGESISARMVNSPIYMFMQKARKIIKKSRAIRQPTIIGCIGPTGGNVRGPRVNGEGGSDKDGTVSLRPSGEVFSDSDKAILEFIWDTHIRLPANLNRTKHHSVSTVILRAIGAYPHMVLEDKIGRLVLQEMGAMAPWAGAADDNLLFPIPGRKAAHKTNQLLESAEAALEKLPKQPASGHPQLQDTMADLREDLGSMEVFCIDDAGTTLVDDGVSLEECIDRPNCWWIHTHVAHPAASFDARSEYGRLARNQQSSWYTTNAVYPMIPDVLGESLNLEPGAAALTTSILLSEEGQILDTKMRLTRVHNVVTLTHAAVDHVVGIERPSNVSLIVGSDLDMQPSSGPDQHQEHIDQARRHEKTLKKMRSLLTARINAREREVLEPLNLPMKSLAKSDIEVSFLEEYESTRLHQSIHYEGDPTIVVKAPVSTVEDLVPADMFRTQASLVTNLMILTCESAGKWMGDRGIPAIYTGALCDPSFPVGELNKIAATMRKNKGKGADAAFFIGPRAAERDVPVPHTGLSVGAYARVTSPLRRFEDLLNQWNIGAYLRAVANGHIADGQLLDEENQQPYPVPRSEVRDIIARDRWIINEGAYQAKKAQQHWIFHALFRAFHFREAQLPQIFDMRVSSIIQAPKVAHKDKTGLWGELRPFGIGALVLSSAEGFEKQAKLSSFLPVQIETVDVAAFMVLVRPVGPPTDTPQHVPVGGTVYQSVAREEAMRKRKESGRGNAVP
ncbi:Mitochondrial protein cyt-4 [Cyphellophora attinorum]|uniref:Mitochondrial protein cyt-4 n=1 Tax=Cyphellophora attinorum TaxID=1664694 RepID=A0A0N0NI79_9EURO|nr:Mitochondrial protein cyt-4 [Phialophora attinorum]KPI35428.1 Mitochondrial protein cyt-4 [Phialophora attinorum]